MNCILNFSEEFHPHRQESGINSKALCRRNSCNSMPNINVSPSEFNNTCDNNVYSNILLENHKNERDLNTSTTAAKIQNSMRVSSTSLTLHKRNISECKDVYLGGSCYLRTNWRDHIAIPYLVSQGLTYHLPLLHESLPTGLNDSECSLQRPNLYNPIVLDSSNVLLFYISNETRSLAPMTLAAHCIGLMYNVVLCIQMLPDKCIIGNEMVII